MNGGHAGTDTSGGSGGTSDAACVADDACQAKACALGCFDADRCASDEIAFWGGPYNVTPEALALTPEGDRVLVGHVRFTGSSTADSDVFVVKLAPDGSELWSRRFATPNRDHALDVAVDATGHIHVTGGSLGDFEEPPNENPGESDVFVLKLEPEGTTAWVTLFGSAGNDTGNALALDSDGNVHVVGSWNDDGSLTQREPFIATLTNDGALVTVKNLPSVPLGEAMTIALDAQGHAYVTGRIRAPDSEHWDAFAKKLTSDGSELWSVEWGSTSTDRATGSVLDASGRLYVIGLTNGALDPSGNCQMLPGGGGVCLEWPGLPWLASGGCRARSVVRTGGDAPP